jgi:hypothetical protein
MVLAEMVWREYVVGEFGARWARCGGAEEREGRGRGGTLCCAAAAPRRARAPRDSPCRRVTSPRCFSQGKVAALHPLLAP